VSLKDTLGVDPKLVPVICTPVYDCPAVQGIHSGKAILP